MVPSHPVAPRCSMPGYGRPFAFGAVESPDAARSGSAKPRPQPPAHTPPAPELEARPRLAVGELAALILVDALQAAGGQTMRPPEDAAVAAAEIHGRRAGEAAIARRGPLGSDPLARRDRFTHLLRELGYASRPTRSGTLALTSCPFHALARRRRPLLVLLNRAFLAGLLDGLGLDDMEVVLRPGCPADCCGCVTVATSREPHLATPQRH